MRSLVVAALFGAAMYGDDVTLPLTDGTIVIQDAQLIGPTVKSAVPEFSFLITNRTSSAWDVISLQFDVKGTCRGYRIARTLFDIGDWNNLCSGNWMDALQKSPRPSYYLRKTKGGI